MKIEEQVTSLELSKRLKELGVKQESYFSHDLTRGLIANSKYVASHSQLEWISAFTVAELGEMLPDFIESENQILCLIQKKVKETWYVRYEYQNKHSIRAIVNFQENSEANARAKMLVYLLENKLITP